MRNLLLLIVLVIVPAFLVLGIIIIINYPQLLLREYEFLVYLPVFIPILLIFVVFRVWIRNELVIIEEVITDKKYNFCYPNLTTDEEKFIMKFKYRRLCKFKINGDIKTVLCLCQAAPCRVIPLKAGDRLRLDNPPKLSNNPYWFSGDFMSYHLAIDQNKLKPHQRYHNPLDCMDED